nr:hypothetical protein [Tanacetum cinerariifolium]
MIRPSQHSLVVSRSIQYPHFIKLIVADLIKKFPIIPKRLEEDYHSIKDDVLLVSVYTKGNVLVRGMLILDVFFTVEIRETYDFKEAPRTPTITASPYESKKRKQTAGESSSRRIIIKKKKQSTPSIPSPRDDRERGEMAEATILSLTLHKNALDAEAKENIAKEYPKHVSDDDDEKKKKDEEVEKEKEVAEIVMETNVDDISAKKNNEVVTKKEVVDMSGIQEIRKEKNLVGIMTQGSFGDASDLPGDSRGSTVRPTNATSSKTPSTTTCQEKYFTLKTRRLPGTRLVQTTSKASYSNPEWNKHQVVLDQPEQPWFNQMVSTSKDPSTFDDLMATPIDFSNIKLEYNMEECFKALIDRLDWNNPEGYHYPFDLSKPLPLKGRLGHLTAAAKYIFNNDLEFMKSSYPMKNYTTSIMKIKVARYDIVKILSVVSVKVERLHGYGHLDEILVKIADRHLYKFKEGDFVDLHLNDIEDMLLFAVQHRLVHLNKNDIVDFIVALRMFTRSPIIKRRVEDLQLGVESYQKKLNITAPQKIFPEIVSKELYTPSYKPPGIIYEDLNKH